MKTYIFPLVLFFALMSCEEENPQPIRPFVGSWHLISEDPQVTIAFDVVYESGIYNYTNRRVVHPSIPENQQTNNNMITYDPFENGMGYGRIEIKSRGTFQYDVTLIYNRFIYNEATGKYDMAVYDVQIDIPSEPFIILQDQTFTYEKLR